NPITITPDDVVSNAVDIFQNNNFHRLPVVDKSNHVVGLITERTRQENVSPCHFLDGNAISFQPSMRPFAELKLTPIIRMGSPQDWNFS
ncbi:MAG: CBS domain-containing protein, partial [Victivallales bacterium]|nr:CBS domain-containing protein [Victivallales bacterium]